jgi:hypothetical protein
MLKLAESSDSPRGWSVALRAVAAMAVVGAGVGVMNAQSSFVASGASAPAPAYSSSAAGETEAQVVAPLPDFSRMMIGAGGGHAQYYGGRPRYYGYKNGDDSARFTIYGGGGTMMPLADTSNYLTRNFSIQAGMGPGFSRFLKVPVEFDWDQFGFTKSTLDNQIAIYDSVFGAGTVNYRLGGNSHIWSFSLQPTFTFYSRGAWGVYVKGGVGFYHKVANFTLPGESYACFYFCGTYERNYNIDHYTSNAPGYDGGLGLTTRLAPDSRARLYFEARYVVITNQQRYGITNTPASLATVTNSTTDFYPANSNRTTYIPVEAGIRF